MKNNYKIILLSIVCSSCLLIASNIEEVKDFSKYPLSKEATSISRGGSISDKSASEDGIGTILIGGVGNESNEVNNKSYNQTLKNNKELLSDTKNLKDLTINNSDLNKINENLFVKLNNVNGTFCDDNNPLTVGETYLNDKCQGGTPLHPDGESCNDNDSTTSDDVWLNNICKGSKWVFEGTSTNMKNKYIPTIIGKNGTYSNTDLLFDDSSSSGYVYFYQSLLVPNWKVNTHYVIMKFDVSVRIWNWTYPGYSAYAGNIQVYKYDPNINYIYTMESVYSNCSSSPSSFPNLLIPELSPGTYVFSKCMSSPHMSSEWFIEQKVKVN